MMTKTTVVLTIAWCLPVATTVTGQAPITKSQSITATATIQAIDSTSRTITLRDENGPEDTYSVGPEVKRFDELKVGDTVKMTYYEAVVIQIRKPGEQTGTAGATADPALTRAKGALPGGTLAAQEKITVTVKAIDASVPSVTVTTSDGRTVTRKVENPKNIEGLKVGDQVDITYTRALLTSIERGK